MCSLAAKLHCRQLHRRHDPQDPSQALRNDPSAMRDSKCEIPSAGWQKMDLAQLLLSDGDCYAILGAPVSSVEPCRNLGAKCHPHKGTEDCRPTSNWALRLF